MVDRQSWLTLMAVSIFSSISYGLPSTCQIIPDTTLGAESSQVTPNVTLPDGVVELINGGAVRGSNLFHSFQEFNVNTGQQVYFANPAQIESIISRITGKNASNIFGTLGVLGDANLFLLNPQGFVFGPEAQLDVRGAFAASTSESLSLGNGMEFSASDPQAPPLLTVNVKPGLGDWLNPKGDIENQGNLATGGDLTLF